MSEDRQKIRAAQGHSADSGLTADDFNEVDLGLEDSCLLVHGSFTDRVVSIIEKGLLASGVDSSGGRLFVHWSVNGLDREGQKTGVRQGADVRSHYHCRAFATERGLDAKGW